MIVQLTMGRRSTFADVEHCDVYELPSLDLKNVAGLLIGTGCDQVFLHRQQPILDAFVSAGGRVAVCGDVALSFLSGLSAMTPLQYKGPDDLQVIRIGSHPVWRGVDPGDLTFRRGVAGFYGRAFYPQLPTGATLVHGIGPLARPLDFVYRHGAGEILVHGGNDLWGYRNDATTAARMTPQLLEWMLT